MDSISAADAKVITSNMHIYPWNQTYVAGSIMLEYKENIMKQILEKLNALNSGVIISSPNFKDLPMYDEFYDFRYRIKENYVQSLQLSNSNLNFELKT